MKINHLVLTVTMSALIAGCSTERVVNEQAITKTKQAADKIWPRLDKQVKTSQEIESRISKLLSNMTLEQKVAQMIQPEIRDISVDQMRQYGFGSYLNGGGAFPNNDKHATPADWVDLAEAMYQASIDDSLDGSTIPTMWGTDAVHGHNNVIGATLFPHNIGLGAANNPELIEKIAQVTATEVMVTGIDWVFAPTVAVVRDDRWGRTYEGYSEDPEIVKSYSASIVKGLQGTPGADFLADNRVISTVKHFLGDGGTVGGDDQGDNIDSEQALFDLHAQGYVSGLTVGAQTVMASFNSWHGEKMHGSKYFLTEVLKNQMGFDGLVVGDWNGHGQIDNCNNESCPQSINAGLDIFMVPTDWKTLYYNTIEQVKNKQIAMSRIDDAVSRILRVKLRAGLFDKPSPANRTLSGKVELIGSDPHRKVAQQAVRESLVLLKNTNNILPLNPKLNILVAGDGADNIGKQSGGWSITWQGTNNTNDEFPGGSSIFAGISQQVTAAGGQVELNVAGDFTEKPDVAIVVFGEEPYAEGHGDRESLNYQPGGKKDLALLKKLKAQGIAVVSVFISGRPMWVNAELNASDAFVAAWLPGSEGKAVADVLLQDKAGKVQFDFTGRLSYSWPNDAMQTSVNRFDQDYSPLLPYGFGLSYGDSNVLTDNLSEKLTVDLSQSKFKEIHTGKIQSPWQLLLASGKTEQLISSNTMSLSAAEYRTSDRVVQEDAFIFTAKGNDRAALKIASESLFQEDMFSSLQAGSHIIFDVNVIDAPSAKVLLTMNCEGFGDKPGSCQESIDITALLSKAGSDQWQTLSVDLQCFANQGIKFGQMVSPFELSTQGTLSLGLANIVMAPPETNELTMACD
jgi:beta-glucosidase